MGGGQDEGGAPFRETAERVDVALAVPLRDGRVLVARRQRGLHLAGMWEFPCGSIDAGETPIDAARRELLEETGLTATALEPLVVCVHDYAEAPLRFHVFLAREPTGEVRMDETRDYAWLAPAELDDLAMPDANRQMLKALRWRLGPGRVES